VPAEAPAGQPGRQPESEPALSQDPDNHSDLHPQGCSVEDAGALVLAAVNRLEAEEVLLSDSFGRVLARPVLADIDLAPFAGSAMDGFALVSRDCQAASRARPQRLKVIGRIGAGEAFAGQIGPGSALRIMTGAPLPAGLDAVVRLEDCAVEADGTILIQAPVAAGLNIRPAGQEAMAGDTLLKADTLINAAAAGLLASAGMPRVAVVRRPRVAIISTGSELVDVGSRPGPGQIRSSNSYMLAAAVQRSGGQADILPHVADDRRAFAKALGQAAATHDFVLTSGGAGDGDFDFTGATIQELGRLAFSKVAMQPGKSQSFGLVQGVPVFGLAGNPAAAYCGFMVLVRPALRKMQGLQPFRPPLVRATLEVDGPPPAASPRHRRYLHARLNCADGSLFVQPVDYGQPQLNSLQHANCFLIVPEGSSPLLPGQPVDCLFFGD